jgi:hypothetical protein
MSYSGRLGMGMKLSCAMPNLMAEKSTKVLDNNADHSVWAKRVIFQLEPF